LFVFKIKCQCPRLVLSGVHAIIYSTGSSRESSDMKAPHQVPVFGWSSKIGLAPSGQLGRTRGGPLAASQIGRSHHLQLDCRATSITRTFVSLGASRLSSAIVIGPTPRKRSNLIRIFRRAFQSLRKSIQKGVELIQTRLRAIYLPESYMNPIPASKWVIVGGTFLS
jgi:hypothetical protein